MDNSIFRYMPVVHPDIFEGARTTSTGRSKAEKDAKRFLDMVTNWEFNPDAFGYLLCSMPEEVQEDVFKAMVGILNAMAAKYTTGNCRTDKERDNCQAANFAVRRIIDQMGIMNP